MSNFFCECKDSGEPPCFGLVQLRADLSARDAELARVKAEYANSIAAWTGIEDERKAAEQRAEAAEEAVTQCRVLYNETIQRAVAAERKAESLKALLIEAQLECHEDNGLMARIDAAIAAKGEE